MINCIIICLKIYLQISLDGMFFLYLTLVTLHLGHLSPESRSRGLSQKNSIFLDAFFPLPRCRGGNVHHVHPTSPNENVENESSVTYCKLIFGRPRVL